MKRRINVFWTLWLSYILVLAIPVFIAAFLFTNIKNEMVESANRSNLAMLEQVRQVVDNQAKEIDQLVVQVSNHPKLQTLWNIDDGEQYLEYAEAVAVLRNMRYGQQFIGEFYIHYTNKDIVITPSLKTDTTTYFTRIAPYGHYSVSEIKERMLSRYHFKTYWPSEVIYTENGPNKDVIATAVTLPMGDSNNVRATLVMLIDEEQIYNLLKQMEWASSSFMYIVDGTGQVIMSTSGQYQLPEGLDLNREHTGYQSIVLDNQSLMLSYTVGENDWKYISFTPSEVILKPISRTTHWAVSMLALAILVGAAAAYWMAYRSYGPIRDMVGALMKEKKYAEVESVNEYEFIKSSILHNMAEREQMQSKIADHAPVVRAHALTRMLKSGPGGDDDAKESLEFLGLSFPYKYSCILLVNNDDSSKFRKEDSEKERSLVRFVLYNLSSEVAKEKGYVVETERNQLALLLNLDDTIERAAALRDTIIDDLKSVAEQRFRLKITIAVSSLHEGAKQFHIGYVEAVNALDYQIIHGAGSVIYYDLIKDIKQSYYHYPIESEIRLINNLKSGDYEQIEQMLDEVYEENVVSGEMTSEMSKFLMIDMTGTVIKVMNSLKIDGKQLLQGIDPIRFVMDRTSAIEMLRKTKELCQLICDCVNEARTDHGEALNEQIKSYIANHIADNGLSLTSIADQFGMAPQYISGFFKRMNHQNITEFILERRLDEAKRLLACTSLTMLQIAHAIGYANDIGFIRVFKKQEGITPGKFRELVKEEQQNAPVLRSDSQY